MPIWVAIVFITRASIVDSIRYAAISRGQTPFGSIQSQLGRVLVYGRFMRALYGGLKAATFGWVFLLQPLPSVAPESWVRFSQPALWIAGLLIYASVAVCLLRALPVILEFLSAARPSRATKRARVA